MDFVIATHNNYLQLLFLFAVCLYVFFSSCFVYLRVRGKYEDIHCTVMLVCLFTGAGYFIHSLEIKDVEKMCIRHYTLKLH